MNKELKDLQKSLKPSASEMKKVNPTVKLVLYVLVSLAIVGGAIFGGKTLLDKQPAEAPIEQSQPAGGVNVQVEQKQKTDVDQNLDIEEDF